MLIATTTYQSWPAQPQAQADLELVAKALSVQGFVTHTLINPSLASLTGELKRFGTEFGSEPSNRIVVYLAGYGITHVSPAGRGKGFLALTDTAAETRGSGTVPASRPSGLVSLSDTPREEVTWGNEWPRAISLNELDDWLKKLPVRHGMLILNSCFNGSVFHGYGDVPEELPEVIRAPVRHYLIAGDSFQCEAAPRLFAQTLAETISSPRTDLDRNGLVAASELAIRVQTLVADRSLGQLTPRAGRSTDNRFSQGEMLFNSPSKPSQLQGDVKESPK
ncbi:hypothetical protein [Paucibacter sp. DJ2R-2]|uniref:hypothetical protein n=1 Tax=Paucibacter sp. DJ2R-2 TaxID=2893558 RepID=UPI0021E3C33F|nr:hypothetical protein [Paucibacter sp. DJ2R-2]MCV2441273.1 hypothetical protein [Paucibacter sp. DJ2R-2]